MSTVAPYGSWASPISIDLVLKAGIVLTMPRWDGSDLYWLEQRPLEGGRLAVVRRSGGVISTVTADGFNARTRVHEYGGGSYAVAGGTVWFTNYDDQRLYRQERDESPQPITPDADIRHADMEVDPRRNLLYSVREDHTLGGPEAVNSLVAVDAQGRRDAVTIAAGNDFYSSPRLSADGNRLAWLTWNHPNMPWNTTELWVGELEPGGGVRSARAVAGGRSEAILDPRWGPNGELYFVSDRSGWWNLYRATVKGDEPIARRDAEFGGPQWQLGKRYYGVAGTDEIVCTYAQRGSVKLARLALDTGELSPVELLYNQFTDIDVRGHAVAVIAGSTTLSSRVLTVDLDTGAQEVVRASTDTHIDPGYFSIPHAIEYPTDEGQTAYALHYAPRNRDFEAPAGMVPPAIVHVHGGPTSEVRGVYDLEVQYWTSRGFAYIDVNYRGSTGYGRVYRERLHLRWGEVDVADSINAAKHVVGLGQADARHIAITGGSAGGFTTLLALTKHDYFGAGASLYGVGDLVTFAQDTHKFESRYLEWLVGPFPEALDAYQERSAVNFANRLSCPIILFQGLEDVVVPPTQAEEFVAACRNKGLPYAYVAFEGEQHGFRKASTIRRVTESELYFYSRIFGFEPHDQIEPVTIENFQA